MNRREEPLSCRTRKKIKKIIRASVETKDPLPTPRNLHGQNLAQRPKKIVVQETSRGKALLKNMAAAKKKRTSSPQSKRTSPGSVQEKLSPPAEVHKEGRRWIKTGEKQSVDKAKRLTHKLSKNRS